MPAWTEGYKRTKLKRLLECEGFDDELAFGAEYAVDSVCPAICMNDGCDYTEEMEPDQNQGWCAECSQNTMVSGLVLMGLI